MMQINSAETTTPLCPLFCTATIREQSKNTFRRLIRLIPLCLQPVENRRRIIHNGAGLTENNFEVGERIQNYCSLCLRDIFFTGYALLVFDRTFLECRIDNDYSQWKDHFMMIFK